MKNNKGLYIIIGILVCLVLGLGGFIVKEKLLDGNSSSDSKEKSNGESKITDEELIKDLRNKTGKLFYKNDENEQTEYYQEYGEDYMQLGYFEEYLGLLRNLGLSDQDRLDIVLQPLSYATPTYDEIYNKMRDYYNKKDNFYTQRYSTFEEFAEAAKDFLIMIDEEKVNESYNELFAEKLRPMGVFVGCPGFTYDSMNKVYIGIKACGNATAASVIIYMNKYTMNDDKAYVYLTVGVRGEMNASGEFDNKTHVLSGFSSDSKELDIDSKDLEKEMKKHPDKFDGYRIVFKKDKDDKYKYLDIEKLDK